MLPIKAPMYESTIILISQITFEQIYLSSLGEQNKAGKINIKISHLFYIQIVNTGNII